MRLRESTVYLRLSTFRDALADGTLAACVADVERALSTQLATEQAPRTARVPVERDAAGQIAALQAGAFHEARRVVLEAPPAARLSRVAVVAGAHPYSGEYAVQVDLRVAAEPAWSDAETDTFVALFDAVVAALGPEWAQAHDTDDSAMQNTADAALLRLGFGVEPEPDDDRAGREVARGAYRFSPDWLGYLGAHALAWSREHGGVAPAHVTEMSDGIRWRLAGSPHLATGVGIRSAQRALRDALAFDRLGEAERWAWGYNQARGRRDDGDR